MRLFQRIAIILSVLGFLALPVIAVEPTRDTRTTLTNLLTELRQSYSMALASDSLMVNDEERRAQISEMVKAADEVTIMLYTQKPEYTFDIAFALENVSRLYDSLHENAALSNKYLTSARSGLRRYTLLEETLREMYMNHPVDSLVPVDSLLQSIPTVAPQEERDSLMTPLLDSCLHYTGLLTSLYGTSVALALQDSAYVADTERRLEQAREYAQATYAESQKTRYIGGDASIVHIIKNWDMVIRYVKDDFRTRYSPDPVAVDEQGNPVVPKTWSGTFVLTYAVSSLVMLVIAFLLAWLIGRLVFRFVRSEKARPFRLILSAILAILLFLLGMLLVRTDRGNPYWRMAYQLLSQFAWLTLAILVSLFIRIKGSQAKGSLAIYTPTLLLCFLSILARAVFLPVSVVPLVFPPILLIFIVWQILANYRYRTEVSRADLRYMWVSAGLMILVCILSLCGYSMIGVLILTFWTFELALLHTITTLYYLIKRYYEKHVEKRKERYHTDNPDMPIKDSSSFVEVTWAYDLLQMVVIPIMALISFPISALLTARAYQLSMSGDDILRLALFHDEKLSGLTVSNLIIVIALFFIFRYLIYLVKGVARVIGIRRAIETRTDTSVPLKESDVNLSLPNALFTLLGWLLYLVIVFTILHIPTSAIVAILTGLSAGVGFALKDLINNFFYGIQLMAGRIRVGDKISCDGVRGIVKRVSYQTTQVEDEDGSLIAFTNADLFTKKFRNLNTGKNYELIKIHVNVAYGTDIEFARKVIMEAIEPLRVKDKAGREVIDPSFPPDVRFVGYGDNCIQLDIALYTTVETHYTFPARAMEAIYNAFRENGIKIPFPQRDVYIKSVPEDKKD